MPGGRPPWVKESGEKPAEEAAAPKKQAPWQLRKRQPSVPTGPEPDPVAAVEEQLANAKASLKKQNVAPKTKAPENGAVSEEEEEKPIPKPSAVKKAESDNPNRIKRPPVEKLPPKKPPLPKQVSKDEVVTSKKPPALQRQASKEDTSGGVKKWRDPLLEKVKENIDKTIANEIPKGHTLTKNESLRSLLKPVPPPLPPPMPPKMPPPPEFKKSTISQEKAKRIESLKSRPRKRPDWSDMMKEVESGKKLNHVVCNDRSSPIITKASMVKAKGQYVYESEKGNMHNQLLKQINSGIKLKAVKTNDRSKPNLDGLRKFRRQMTVEEQLQKSMSQANMASNVMAEQVKEAVAAAEDEEIDEMDDIDKVRDDLQSTKQLLALELRNKEAQQRENKRLLQRIANLEAELKSERAHVKQEQAKTVISVVDAYDETLVSSLKREVTETKRVADDLEKKYHIAAEELDEVRSDLEETKRKNAELEKKLEQALKGEYFEDEDEEPKSYFLQRTREFEKQCQVQYNQGILPNSNQNSRRPSHAQRQQSIQEPSEEEDVEESSGEEGENEEEKAKRKLQKELKMLGNKVRNLTEKRDKAKKERAALKVQLKNQQAALKVEHKKYKALKKEVDKMAALMKDTGDDDEDVEDEEDEEEDEPKKPEEEESEEEETESESEAETESETESESEPEDSEPEKKKDFMTAKTKKLETAVSALKKGNYLIIANIDRLKDDVNKQREESASLQQDLDSVLAELE